MNKIIYFIAGAILGAGGTYLYLNKKYEKRLNEEINDIVRQDIEKSKKQKQDLLNETFEDTGVVMDFDENKDYSIYNTQTKDIPDNVVISPVDIEDNMLLESEIIDENEYEDDYYDDDNNLYSKEELFYFTINDIFADANDDPLNEREDHIFVNDEMKQEVIDILHDEYGSEECYLRCHNTKTDYYIICDHRDFRELG